MIHIGKDHRVIEYNGTFCRETKQRAFERNMSEEEVSGYYIPLHTAESKKFVKIHLCIMFLRPANSPSMSGVCLYDI